MTVQMRPNANVVRPSPRGRSVLFSQIYDEISFLSSPVHLFSSFTVSDYRHSLKTIVVVVVIVVVACHSLIAALDGIHSLYGSLCFVIVANFFGRLQDLSLVEELF